MGEQRFDRRFIVGISEGLIDRPLVPIDAEPDQVCNCLAIRAGLNSGPIKVFYAKDNFPAILPGEKPVNEESPRVSKMKRAGGRRGQSGYSHVPGW